MRRRSARRAAHPLRPALTLLPVVAAIASAPSASDAQRVEPQRTMVRGQRVDADGSVRVWNLVGSVRVTGWAHDSVAVVARAGAGTRLFFGGGRRGVKVGIEERGDSASPAALELRVPRGAHVWVKTSTAWIVVNALAGDVELHAVTGAVRVVGRPATLRIEAMAGAVTVADGAGWLRARTASGPITVRGALGDAALATVGGTLVVDGRIAERARLESVTGAIRFTGVVVPDATLAVDTNSGDVALQLGGSAALDLLTLRGRIASPLPTVRAAMRGQGSGQAGVVTLGPRADGGRIEVRSFSGAIGVARVP